MSGPVVHDPVPLLEPEAAGDPFDQFAAWYAEAGERVAAPEAMAVATVDADGTPSLRMVLLKGWDRRGFVFHTNYTSRKGRAIEADGRVALLWHWEPLGRQVRVEGRAARLAEAESDAYFATRPRGAQVGAHASRQSAGVDGRDQLEAQVAEAARRFGDGPVPRPPWWGGYRVEPARFEFWQHREDRLHDRLVYLPGAVDGGTDAGGGSAPGWRRHRLQP